MGSAVNPMQPKQVWVSSLRWSIVEPMHADGKISSSAIANRLLVAADGLNDKMDPPVCVTVAPPMAHELVLGARVGSSAPIDADHFGKSSCCDLFAYDKALSSSRSLVRGCLRRAASDASATVRYFPALRSTEIAGNSSEGALRNTCYCGLASSASTLRPRRAPSY